MPLHLLDPGVLEPLAPVLATLRQRDRARLSLVCKVLNAVMLSAGGWRCTVKGRCMPIFFTWLKRLQGAGGCAGLAVELRYPVYYDYNTGNTVALLCRVAAVGPTELRVESGFTRELHSAQVQRAIQALGAGAPCRLRTLRVSLGSSVLPALNALTTLQRLECDSCNHWGDWDDGTLQWQLRLPQLTALSIGAKHVNLSLVQASALQELILVCYVGATVASRTPLASLTGLSFHGGELSFPWQQARGLKELALLGTKYTPPRVHGARHLAAQKALRAVELAMPLEELPTDFAWLRSVKLLKMHIKRDGLDQAFDLIVNAPDPAKIHIDDPRF